MCVIAAVSVVLPWSTCPIVPTFTCGLVRSNLAFAIFLAPFPVQNPASRHFQPCHPIPLRCNPQENYSEFVTDEFWCPWRGLNTRPLPYQGSALPLSYMGCSRFPSATRVVEILERRTGIEPVSSA